MIYYGYTYITENKSNGKRYIGQHKGEFDPSYLGSGKILTQAIHKYGVDSFAVDVIDYHIDKISLDAHERELIAAHNATSSSMFYNIAKGGEGGNTRAGMTDEQYARYCDALKVAQNDPELLARRSKISKDVYDRPGVREKLTQHSREKWTPELRQKMSDSAKKAHSDPVVRELHRQRAYERAESSQYIENQRKQQLGRKWYHNPRTGEKMTIGPYDSKDVPKGWIRGQGPNKNKHNI